MYNLCSVLCVRVRARVRACSVYKVTMTEFEVCLQAKQNPTVNLFIVLNRKYEHFI